MAQIEVEVDIDAYLDEASTDELIEELISRRVNVDAITFDTPLKVAAHLKDIFGLRPFHSKERILGEVKQLLKLL